MAMFSKIKSRPTLVETYEEAERVEAEKESIEDYPELPEEKLPGEEPYCCLNLKRNNHMILREC